MKLHIESEKLIHKLQERQSYIGVNRQQAIEYLVSAFMISYGAITCSYPDFFIVPGKLVAFIALMISIGLIVRVVMMIKDNYDYKELYEDIENIEGVKHKHSIVVIRDTFNKCPSKFLVYRDKRWECDFFPNYKTVENDEGHICQQLSADLQINIFDISVYCKMKVTHDKYSESAKENKLYEHRIYSVEIRNFPKNIKSDSFSVNGKDYKWMTMEEMISDKDIQEKNLDIVGYVNSITY